MAGPLEGIKVIECNRVAPGSLATVLLADMGADVIRVVEPSVGDRERTDRPTAPREAEAPARGPAAGSTATSAASAST